MVADAPEADVAPPRIAVMTDCGMVSDPPRLPAGNAMVKGVLPPVRLTAGALKLPVAAIAPVKVAVPEAEADRPAMVSVAFTDSVTLEVAACATAQANNA